LPKMTMSRNDNSNTARRATATTNNSITRHTTTTKLGSRNYNFLLSFSCAVPFKLRYTTVLEITIWLIFWWWVISVQTSITIVSRPGVLSTFPRVVSLKTRVSEAFFTWLNQLWKVSSLTIEVQTSMCPNTTSEGFNPCVGR